MNNADTKTSGFIFLFNTLIGSGLFLLPGIASGAGGGGYLIPIMALPVLLYAYLFIYYISKADLPRGIKTVLKWLYCAACTVASAAAIALCALLCRDIILPDASAALLIAAFVFTLYLATASQHCINGLNSVFFICFILIIICMLFSLTEFKLERLTLELSSPINALFAILPFFAGLITVPHLAKSKARRQSMCGAVVLACIIYALLTALCIGTLGQLAREKYSMYITLKSGESLLDIRLLIASIAFSLSLIKPAINLTYAATSTLPDKRWLKPAVMAVIFIFALILEKVIGSLF